MAKVLIVEDDREISELIREELADAGHEIFIAKDGVEGLEAFRTQQPQIVCCDVNMPKMNGLQLKQKLDDFDLLDEKTRFIFISAQAAKSDISDGLMMGADKYITKPINFDELINIVSIYSAE